MTPFGARLRELRAQRDVTLKDLAAALQVSPAYLSALEHGRRGRPSAGLVHQVNEYFGLIWDDAEELARLARQSHPRVVLEHGTRIGNRVIIQAGAVLGGDGFKFEVINGRWQKIPQVGRVVIEDDVEIGANTTIDRASFTETHIGAGTKIDNLVQIAHNVRIGRDCVVVAQVGIAGSSTVGDGSILAAQVGVADNLRLGKGVRVMARSGVKDDIPDGRTVLGAPARPFRVAARIMAAEAKLPELVAQVTKLSEKVAELERKLSGQKTPRPFVRPGRT